MGIKKILAVILSGILLFELTACNSKIGGSSEKIKLVASFYPVYIIAMNITDGVSNVELSNMTEQNTGCLHDFQLSTEDMRNLEKANAVIINGAGMEGFMNNVIAEMPDKKIIDSSTGINLIENTEHEDHDDHNHDADEDHDHDHGEMNSHIWVSISNYIKQVQNISEGIIAIDSKNADKYQENTTKYIEKLTSLNDKMHSELKDVKNKDIITLHESFDYFAKEFDLNIVEVINHEPNTEPSSKELSQTISTVNESQGKIPLFVEPQYPTTSAEIISKETGAKVYTLDSAVTGSMDKDAYIKAMEANLKVLKEALV